MRVAQGLGGWIAPCSRTSRDAAPIALMTAFDLGARQVDGRMREVEPRFGERRGRRAAATATSKARESAMPMSSLDAHDQAARDVARIPPAPRAWPRGGALRPDPRGIDLMNAETKS